MVIGIGIASLTVAVTAGFLVRDGSKSTTRRTTPAGAAEVAGAPASDASGANPSAPAPAPTAVNPSVAPRDASAPATRPPDAKPVVLGPTPKGWKVLASLNGTADATSAVFHLNGIDTQLRFVTSSIDTEIYLVDATKGLDATAGYPEVSCSGDCHDEHFVLVDRAGDYTLMVHSTGGSWAVAIEEYPVSRR